MSTLPKKLEIIITKEQPDLSNRTSEPSKALTMNGEQPEKPDQDMNMLRSYRTPPYRTGPKKEPGTEDEPCEDAIASGDVTPSWEGVWRKDRRDVTHQGPGGAS